MRVMPSALVSVVFILPLLADAEDRPHRRLTSFRARSGQAFFSPDGTRISFVSNRSGRWQVWVMAADGSSPARVTQIDADVGWPSWTPDGRAILFYARVDGRFKVFRTNLAGEHGVVFDDGHDDFRPLLSGDGRQLLFDRYGATEPANHDIYRRDLESGDVKRLTDHIGYDSDARWSPDGTRIVFHSDRGASQAHHTDIYAMNADGTGLVRLTIGPGKCAYPTWSPDGTKIAYVAEVEGNRDVWIMNADGTDRQRVTTHPGADAEPAWSPDGKSLVVPSDRFGGMELVQVPVP